MKHTGFALALAGTMTVWVLAAESPVARQYAVPRQDLYMTGAAATEPGWTVTGTEYDCLGRSPQGFNILLHQEGKPVVACIPFRDEWGRPTVEASEFKLLMITNTLRTLGPVKLGPGWIVLKRGERYPASVAGKDILIHYRFMDLATNILVREGDVAFPVDTPALPDPALPGAALTDADKTAPAPAASQPVSIVEKVEKEAKDAPTPAARVDAPVPVKPEPPAPPEKPVAPETAKEPAGQKLDHAAIGATIKASSTHTGQPGENPPEVLIDGLLSTRWSSEYAEPQEITLEFKEPLPVGTLKLYWETASATRYRISTTENGRDWKVGEPVVKLGPVAPRTDTIPMNGVMAKTIRIDLLTRINAGWGFSLYEIEVQKP